MSDNTTHPGILRFTPRYRSVRWGGRRISTFKGVQLNDDRCGESWEISPVPQMETIVSKGPYEGLTLKRLLQNLGNQIMGPVLTQRYGHNFPILIKFIDAEEDLSIQVHPNDTAAEGKGKTELWYIIDALPGSRIYSGFNQNLTPDAMLQIINNREVASVMATHFSQQGDVFYLPAGRIHSIGAGNLILEIQQPSDITYRLWDWDRRDRQGNLRPLHIKQAMESVDFSQTDYGLAHPQLLDNRETIVKRSPYFTVTAARVNGQLTLPVKETQSFRILVAVEGTGTVTDSSGNQEEFNRGQTLLIPYATENVKIESNGHPMKIITIYME